MTTDSDERRKLPFRQRTAALRRRILWWLHDYLALDVAPRDDPAPDRPVPADHAAAAPARAADADATPRPETGPVARATAETVPIFDPGECIAGVYDVLEVLTGGELSTAYLAHHRQWDIDVIVKLPAARVATNPVRLREWTASVERWTALGVHPHIASCYGVQSLDGLPVAVTEHAGDSARTWMDQHRLGDLRAALHVAIGVCDGLEHVHGRGVVHGGLTPETILLTPQGTCKLSDFETACAVGAPLPSAGVPPAYLAPERCAASCTALPAVDVFGLGVCLYEMLFGRPPWASTSGPPQRLPGLQVLGTGEPPPDPLLDLLRSCLEWTPHRRPATVETVRGALRTLHETLFGMPHKPPPDPVEQAAAWNAKAVSYDLMGHHTDAEAAWAAALEADPACRDAWFNRGVARWRRGLLTDEALLAEIETLPVATTERWTVRYLAALVHLERGDLDAADTLLERAQRDRPDVAEVRAARERRQHQASREPARPAVVGEHSEYVSAVRLSADGRLAVSASDDTTAVLWNVETGTRVRVFAGHGAPLSCVDFDAAHSAVLTGSADGTMRLWDAQTGACQRVFETRSGRIPSASISPHGRLLLWAGVRSSEQVEQITLQLWNLHTGRHVRTFEGLSKPVKSVCFSADERVAATGGDDQTVHVWDVESGACLQVLTGHDHVVSGVCISADGRFILSGSWDRTVRLWDMGTGELLRTFEGHLALVTSVCLSADAHWALSGCWDGSVCLWEVPTGRCVRTFRGHTGLVMSVGLSADGQCGLSGSWDRTVRAWDTAAGRREPCRLRVSAGGAAPA